MNVYIIDYYERVNNYWCREIESDTLENARDKFLSKIQGTEPDHIDVINAEFE